MLAVQMGHIAELVGTNLAATDKELTIDACIVIDQRLICAPHNLVNGISIASKM